MTHEFKLGDKVRVKTEARTVKTAEQRGAPQWLTFGDGSAGWSDNFELVEPSITHRELREVCERHIQWHSHPSIQLALKQLMHALTEVKS